GKLILAGLSGRIPADVRSQFQRQAEAFRVAFGSLPDYYDGHQHCHCLPGLAALAARLPRAPATWIRVPLPATPAGLWRNLRAGGPKVSLIAAFAFAARRRFRASGWPANTDFSGFLRLDRPEPVR